MVLSAKLLLGASDALNSPIAPKTNAPPFLRRPPIDTASLTAIQRPRHQHPHALFETAFAYFQARCRNAKLLLSVSDAPCAQFAPETDAPPILRRPPIDTASLAR
jgi:hypothetical protein